MTNAVAKREQGGVPAKRGRPKAITPEIANRICELLANGRSLRKIAAMPGMPARSTIEREIITNEAFSGQYRRARAAAGDFWADRVTEIGEDVLHGKHDPQAARVASANFMWAAAKLNPKVYGDNQHIDVNANVSHSAAEGAPSWIKDALGGGKVIDVTPDPEKPGNPGEKGD